MPHAAIGISCLAASLAAGEAATLEALVRCNGAHTLILFATLAHAARLGDVVNGARSLAGDIRIAACASHGVIAAGELAADGPTIVALAIAGDGFLFREAQARRGTVDGTALARELGAPRDVRAIIVLPGPDVGDVETVARAITNYSGSASTTVGAAPGSISATSTAPYASHMEPEVYSGGSFAWLMAGAWQLASVAAPWDVPAEASWAYGLYFGDTMCNSAGDLVAIRSRFPDLPLAGLVGQARTDGSAGAAFMLLFGPDAG